MIINRKTEISKEKDIDVTCLSHKWTNGKHYHRLVVRFISNELNIKNQIDIEKKLWFVYGHNDSEGLDKIWSRSDCDISYKTQNIENLTPELEKKMIQQIVKNLKNTNKKQKKQIKEIEVEIIENDNNIKTLLKSEFFREDKLNRIVDED